MTENVMTAQPALPVVVGISPGERNEAPLRWAAEQARRLSSPLLLVRAYEPVGCAVPFAQWDPDVTRRAAQRQLDHLAARVRERFPDLEVRTIAQAGLPGRVLGRHAPTARLVVVGTCWRGKPPGGAVVVPVAEPRRDGSGRPGRIGDAQPPELRTDLIGRSR